MLTAFSVARSQLLTAVDLFFADGDPVSIHTLAGAAREILEDLCRSRNIEPMTEFILRDHPGRTARDIWNAANLYRTAFKHVGRNEKERRDNQAARAQFHEDVNDFVLYICAEDYIRLRGAMPVPLQIFHAWFCAVHSDILAPQHDPQLFLRGFPNILTRPRSEQKRHGREMVERWLNNSELLSDPRTEPLRLPEEE